MFSRLLRIIAVLLALPFLMHSPVCAYWNATGATGFTTTYSNSVFATMVIPWSPSPPGFRCHVGGVTDGSLPFGSGGAQVQWTPGGPWYELEACVNVDSASQIRVNSWSSVTVTDPPEIEGASREESPCDCEMSPGLQAWTRGPETPGLPLPEVGSPIAVAVPDTLSSPGPFEFVVDYEEGSLVTRITNTPRSQGIVLAKGLIGPNPLVVSLLPGESARFLPDGQLGEAGTVLVIPRGDTTVPPGTGAEVWYDVYNLSSLPADFTLLVSDAQGWNLLPPPSQLHLLPHGSAEVAVGVLVPDSSYAAVDMIILRAHQEGRPGQFHVGTAYVSLARHWADHNVGNCVLTVTDQGILGFMDATQAEGSGFRYPRGGTNQLFVGSSWVGLDPGYTANRDYDADPAREWVVASNPDGHVCDGPDSLSDQDIRVGYTDSGAVAPRLLHVEQRSFAFEAPGAMGEFVLLVDRVENRSLVPMEQVYAGVFLDYDLGTSAYDDQGLADPTTGLAYMSDPSGLHAGIALLQREETPVPVGNVTLIHNPTFVWPNGYVPDADKYAFLGALDPGHVLLESTQANDYSLLASAGPFPLPPGEIREVAFAIVAGSSAEGVRQAAAVAQLVYARGPAAVEGGTPPENLLRSSSFVCRPNPFWDQVTIDYRLSRREPGRLEVFSATGQRLRVLWSGYGSGVSERVVWDGSSTSGRPLPSGVYFIRLKGRDSTLTRTAILIQGR